LGISKTASKDSDSGLQMTFFRDSEKFWKNQLWDFGSNFTVGDQQIGPMHCSIAALQHCSIAALQHCSITILSHYNIIALQYYSITIL
jgi:hypothetical protein